MRTNNIPKEQLANLKKELKRLGCAVKTETNSFGSFLSVKRNKEYFPSMFFGESHRQKWIDVIEVIKKI